VFEGESRKIGDIILPERVWEALDGGVNLKLEAPLERRVQVLLDDYLADDDNRGQLRAQLPFIETRLGPKRWRGELVALLDGRRDAELVEVLLERYYDPLYAHSEGGRVYAAAFDASDPQACARDLAAWIESA
jgi:tRNA 2-selenouridine synthase